MDDEIIQILSGKACTGKIQPDQVGTFRFNQFDIWQPFCNKPAEGINIHCQVSRQGIVIEKTIPWRW